MSTTYDPGYVVASFLGIPISGYSKPFEGNVTVSVGIFNSAINYFICVYINICRKKVFTSLYFNA